jgi:ATP phosphoribosyltransferase
MRQISSAEAFRDLNTWNSDSRIGCIYTVRDVDAVFSVRRGKLDIRGTDIFLESEDGKALLHLADCKFSVTEPHELPFQLKHGFPPLSRAAIKAVFKNEDVCFFFPERT